MTAIRSATRSPTRTLDLRAAARRLRPQLDSAPALRGAAIATWRQRMINEYGSAAVFVGLAAQFEASGASAAEVRAVAAMADEEQRHGVLCGAVVEALGGQATGRLPAAEPLPLHPEVEPIEALARNLLSVGCLSETVAVALISAEREEMAEGPLRTILTEILADEIGHARLGWRWIARAAPCFDAAARQRLGDYLALAFGHLEAHEHHFLPLTAELPDGAEQLGLCSGQASRALFAATVETVIVPRLEQYGLPAGAAWHRRRCPARPAA